jgi:hypothetical protein
VRPRGGDWRENLEGPGWGGGRVVTRAPHLGADQGDPVRMVAICFLSALFATHFMTAFGFLVLFGIFMPNLAKQRRAAARAASKP